MTKKRIYAHIILDRSGSMAGSEAATIKAINDYVDGLGKESEEISSRVSLTQFDTQGIDLVADTVKPKDFIKLTRETYAPRGGTPLYDAIGKTVHEIDKQTRREGENVALVILTDGLENSSKEFTQAKIAALLKDRQEKKNWLVIYLGADHDAWEQGASVGTVAMNTSGFDKANFIQASAAMTRGTVDYAKTSNRAAGAFTDTERVNMTSKPKVPNADANSE